jgi:hypothetical protein
MQGQDGVIAWVIGIVARRPIANLAVLIADGVVVGD